MDFRKLLDPAAAAPAPSVPAPEAPKPGLHLRAGAHIIDGQPVDIPGEHGEMVWTPLSVGRHIIDDKITYVHNPRAGIQVRPPMRADSPL